MSFLFSRSVVFSAVLKFLVFLLLADGPLIESTVEPLLASAPPEKAVNLEFCEVV